MSIIMIDTIQNFVAVDKLGLLCFESPIRPEKVTQSGTWWNDTFPVIVENFEILSYIVFPRFVDSFMETPFC